MQDLSSSVKALAALIKSEIRPASVLEIGCPTRILVEELRRLNIDAFSFANPPDFRQTPPSPSRNYDLVVLGAGGPSLSVSEQQRVVEDACSCANDILLVTLPENGGKRPAAAAESLPDWAELMSRYGFFRDLSSEFRSGTTGAARFRKGSGTVQGLVSEYERKLLQFEQENLARRASLMEQTRRLEVLEQLLDKLTGQLDDRTRQFRALDEEFSEMRLRLVMVAMQLQATEARLQDITHRASWRIIDEIGRRRLLLIPRNSRRERLWYKGIRLLRSVLEVGITATLRNVKRAVLQGSASDRTFGTAVPAGAGAETAAVLVSLEQDALSRAQLLQEVEHASNLAYRPLMSVVAAVYNPDPQHLAQTIESVAAQTYDHWELILADGASTRPGVREVLEKWSKKDSRIQVKFLEKNGGISANSNAALEEARGEFVVLLDHDDLLAPSALFEMTSLLNRVPQADMIYSDEDRIDEDGRRHTPFFKPDWSPDLLLCFMYTGHLTVYRRELVRELGGFRSAYDFSQDYDLALRVVEKARSIQHVPKILYHWRVVSGSAAAGDKPFARQSNLAALAAAVERRGWDAEVMEYPTANRVKFRLRSFPLVSVVVPTDSKEYILPCVEALLQTSSYPHLEIVVVTNSALAAVIGRHYETNRRVQTVAYDAAFNFSAKCNRGAEAAGGEFVLFLNDDVRPMDPGWIECMLEQFQQDGVGAVSPKMIYVNGCIQHAGLVSGVRGFVGTAFHQETEDSPVYFNLLQSTRTVSALSAACLLMRKAVFREIGGFDEVHVPIMHSDVDLCYKIRMLGLRLVYTPFTVLKHSGHASIGRLEKVQERPHSSKADMYLIKRWGEHISYDPYYPDRMRDFLYKDSPTPYRMFAADDAAPAKTKADLLCVSHDLTLSGAPIICQLLSRYLKAAGFFVSLISPMDGELRSHYREEKMPVLIDPLILQAPDTLAGLLKDHDLVIAHTILSWRVVLAAKALGKKVLWLIHESKMGVDLAQSNESVQLALSFADHVIFPSQQTLDMYARFAKNRNQQVVHYGIEEPRPAAGRERTADGSVLKIVHAGSVEPRKGQDVLLRSLRRMPANVQQQFEIFFIGRGLDESFEKSLRTASARLSNVHWIGQLSQPEVLSHIADADIFVCTSRDETGPLVVIEAMALARAVISARVGLVPEIIADGTDGLLVDVDDERMLVEKLLLLARDKSKMGLLGEAARRKYESRLTVRRYAQDIQDLVEELL